MFGVLQVVELQKLNLGPIISNPPSDNKVPGLHKPSNFWFDSFVPWYDHLSAKP